MRRSETLGCTVLARLARCPRGLRVKDLVALSILVAGIAIILSPSPAVAARPPNIIILMSDDQRWDKVTPEYMPNMAAIRPRR